jgi:hypothetical protein
LKQFNVTSNSHFEKIESHAFTGCINLKNRNSIKISNENLQYTDQDGSTVEIGVWDNEGNTNNFIRETKYNGTNKEYYGALGCIAFGEINLSKLNALGYSNGKEEFRGFQYCTNITNIIFPATPFDENKTAIARDFLNHCINLEQEIVIPD